MKKPLKRNFKTARGYDNAMKKFNDFKRKESNTKRTNRINKTEVKNKQKLGKGVNTLKKKITKSVKTNAPKIKNRALKIAKGTVNTTKGLGLSAAAIVAERGINNVVDRGFKQLKKETRGKNMTLKEYRAKRDAAVKKANSTRGINRIPGAIKKTASNIKNRVTKKDTSKLTGKEKAQALAKKRIGKGTAKNPDKTIASINASNKKKMRDAARKRNEAFKKKQEAFRNRKLKISNKKKKRPALTNIK